MFTLVLSNKLCLFCCYFGGSPKKHLEALQNRVWLDLKKFYNLKNFKFHFYCLEFWNNNSGLQQFVFSNSMQPANSKWWVHWIVKAWWYVRICTVCQSEPQWMFVRLIQCCFPQEPLKLSVPGNNYMFPRGSPNIQGIRHHLACTSLFLSLTLCIAFYFPLSSSLSILSASQQYKHSISLVSLWFHLKWSHSFFLQPAHPPGHLIDQFLIFLCLFGQWCIAEYNTGLQLMINFIIDYDE